MRIFFSLRQCEEVAAGTSGASGKPFVVGRFGDDLVIKLLIIFGEGALAPPSKRHQDRGIVYPDIGVCPVVRGDPYLRKAIGPCCVLNDIADAGNGIRHLLTVGGADKVSFLQHTAASKSDRGNEKKHDQCLSKPGSPGTHQPCGCGCDRGYQREQPQDAPVYIAADAGADDGSSQRTYKYEQNGAKADQDLSGSAFFSVEDQQIGNSQQQQIRIKTVVPVQLPD